MYINIKIALLRGINWIDQQMRIITVFRLWHVFFIILKIITSNHSAGYF